MPSVGGTCVLLANYSGYGNDTSVRPISKTVLKFLKGALRILPTFSRVYIAGLVRNKELEPFTLIK